MKKSNKCIKIIFYGMIVSILTVYILTTSQNREVNFITQNIEALSIDDESGDVHRLKKINCECTNGKKGFTIVCKSDGNLEKCTEIQQGSTTCYKLSVLNQEIEILCDKWKEIK